ncbi:heavy-metal-associated domain-containing protein [Chlorobium phaeobacteroides]|jgi:copper chaperone|uniref:Heavy metal transport/detoxification protein n=1 Tax=Chlorobium phaeobacteroides (strain DSM 266 / SMG 266 / 2430) TaxID=290317 RepID=A1BI71_CHLPD|nr:heavy-metal-associated domain-containing protein [Chlorobium phaeobacteroides]ABL66098.1 Heavy metal transport/detoxification protein [Chlorobium phaeobacteroides DSM 266]MBV5319638.1 heavy-metal-associated domain-containing protein [Chlorobium phaeobacteroides]
MKKEFQVAGMRCSNCELLVKEALEELDGVERACPSHKTGTVAVEYNSEKVSVAALRAVIEQQGFSVNE